MTPADADLRRAMRRLCAMGLFPPWKGSELTEADVRSEWADECNRRKVSGADLHVAIDDFRAKATGTTRWPPPGEVLPEHGSHGHAVADVIPGCGACTVEGFRELAWHHTGRDEEVIVDVMVAYCGCKRGENARQRRALPLSPKGQPREPGTSLDAAVGALRARAGTLGVYVDPTAAQRIGPRPPTAPRYAGMGVFRAAVEDVKRGRTYEGEQAARRVPPVRTWSEADNEDEEGRW